MNADDYLEKVKRWNPKVFAAKKIKITPESLANQIRAAFDAGYREGGNAQSIFEKVFGK